MTRLCVGEIIERLRLLENTPSNKDILRRFVRLHVQATEGRPTWPRVKVCIAYLKRRIKYLKG